MPSKQDKQYLATQQYRDSSNLHARGSLHARFSTNRYPWFRWVFDQILSIAPASARILEVGAGPAGLWRENSDRLPAGWQVTLTDLSDGMVAEQRAALGESTGGATFAFRQADVEALPFADAALDVAIANHMLYHVPDRPKALAELRRVLRPGGALIAVTNGDGHMRELDELARPYVRDSTQWDRVLHHAFSLENGLAQLEPYFDEITLRRYDDGLAVDEVEPLVAYIHSIGDTALDTPERIASFTEQAHGQIERGGGVFHITKSVGMFVARRRD